MVEQELLARKTLLFKEAEQFAERARQTFALAEDSRGLKASWIWFIGVLWRARMRIALVKLEELVGFENFAIDELFAQAKMLEQVGWGAEALRYLGRIFDLELNPSPDHLARALVAKAEIFARRGDHGAAEAIFVNAVGQVETTELVSPATAVGVLAAYGRYLCETRRGDVGMVQLRRALKLAKESGLTSETEALKKMTPSLVVLRS